MISKPLLLILILLAATIKSQSKVGYAYQSYPDVIKCGDVFYYLERSAPNFSRYNAFTGSKKNLESYDAKQGVLSNKVGSFPGNCENETIESLWENNRAFRIFNLNRAPDRSIQNDVTSPDVIQCQHGILMYFQSKLETTKQYRNPTGPVIDYVNSNNSLQSLWAIACEKKSLNSLIAQKKTYNIATEQASSKTPSISMTGTIPDLLKCRESSVYLHSISADNQWVVYRGPTTEGGLFQIKFQNGNYHSTSSRGSLINDCWRRSISQLINQGKGINLNSPILKCPSDIQSVNPVVQFKAISTGNLNLNYSHKSNTAFPVGQKTTVTVTGTHANSDINLSCTFGVKILDKKPPSVTCPANIVQRHRIAYFSAKAKDDVTANPNISYSQASGSEFSLGETIVTVTASDEAGNQAKCTFSVTVDRMAPILACPEDIIQKDQVVNFAASAFDNRNDKIKIAYSQESGSSFPNGQTLVFVTATDELGNQTQCTFSVIIDSEPPNLTCPANITSNNRKVTFAANASDSAGSKLRVLYSQAPGSKFSVGDTEVKVSATDAAGNKNECSFMVKVTQD